MTKHEYFIQYDYTGATPPDSDYVVMPTYGNEFFTSSHSGKDAVAQLRNENPEKKITITNITKL